MRNFILFLRWLLYCAFTQRERLAFHYGTLHGVHCSDYRDVGWLPGSEVEVTTHPGVIPHRLYLTRREYFQRARVQMGIPSDVVPGCRYVVTNPQTHERATVRVEGVASFPLVVVEVEEGAVTIGPHSYVPGCFVVVNAVDGWLFKSTGNA